jgi:hypothetical protein
MNHHLKGVKLKTIEKIGSQVKQTFLLSSAFSLDIPLAFVLICTINVKTSRKLTFAEKRSFTAKTQRTQRRNIFYFAVERTAK